MTPQPPPLPRRCFLAPLWVKAGKEFSQPLRRATLTVYTSDH